MRQFILIASVLLGSWLGMQAIHELGHVFGAWISGGQVERVVLHPLTISRTDLASNPNPLLVVWAGPFIGVVAPLILWAIVAVTKRSFAFVLRFFAGFCLVANGLYIGVGSFNGVGDCGEMLGHGSSLWHLWLFGAITVPTGFWLWHRQGRHFGLCAAKGHVEKRVAYGCLVVFAALLVLGLVVDGD